MKRYGTALKLVAMPLAMALAAGVATAQSSVGSLTVSGPVLVDGQPASGTIAAGSAVRLSTGDNGSISLKLAQGGELTLAGQADVIVTNAGTGPRVQLVCGEVAVTSTVPATIISANGARVTGRAGHVAVTDAGKTVTIKQGKTKDFNSPISVAVTGAESTAVVTSNIKCNCACR